MLNILSPDEGNSMRQFNLTGFHCGTWALEDEKDLEREKEEADNSREGESACKSLHQDESPLNEI